MAGDVRRLGVYGFGAAAHIVAQLAHWRGQEVYAFTRPGDDAARQFALDMGVIGRVTAAGRRLCFSTRRLPLRSANSSLRRLSRLRKAGVLVCGGIHMSDIPSFPLFVALG